MTTEIGNKKCAGADCDSVQEKDAPKKEPRGLRIVSLVLSVVGIIFTLIVGALDIVLLESLVPELTKEGIFDTAVLVNAEAFAFNNTIVITIVVTLLFTVAFVVYGKPRQGQRWNIRGIIVVVIGVVLGVFIGRMLPLFVIFACQQLSTISGTISIIALFVTPLILIGIWFLVAPRKDEGLAMSYLGIVLAILSLYLSGSFTLFSKLS